MAANAIIERKRGDLLTENVEALVNTVNCVGVMGRGVALQFKQVFPENFKHYQAAYRRAELRPGQMLVFETMRLTNPRFIINFPTKRHWRGKSRLDDIEAGLADLVHVIKDRGIKSVAIPPLGSGLGGLDWLEVRPRIEEAVAALDDVRVVIFEPSAEAARSSLPRGKVPTMTPGRAALVGLVHRYLAGLLDPVATLLEVHKLMYFMQEAGEPLKLRFTKAAYGPYAENLRHVLQAVEGHYLAGYTGADKPIEQLSLVPGAFAEAEATLSSAATTRSRFDRVSQLVSGFESPHGLELLATVHWVAKHEGATSPDDVRHAAYAWSTRKRRFSAAQLDLAFQRLLDQRWLEPRLAT